MKPETMESVRNTARAAESLIVLLRSLVDYAGLFPPASLAMPPAVQNYDTYLQSENSWILGRFIVPVARLGEFENALESVLDASGARGPRWRLSVLLGSDPSADVAWVREFNARWSSAKVGYCAEVQSVEVKITKPDEIARLSRIIPAELETYFETPLSRDETHENERECIAAIAAAGRRAKIRTGGETADKFHSPESILGFMQLCSTAKVPFKATAGLHHPLRSLHRLTYQIDSPSAVMHGFMNVFLAAAFLESGLEPALTLKLLKEESPEALHFDSDGVIWCEHRLSVSQIAAARQCFSISFGSCSFTEPIEDLRALNLL